MIVLLVVASRCQSSHAEHVSSEIEVNRKSMSHFVLFKGKWRYRLYRLSSDIGP